MIQELLFRPLSLGASPAWVGAHADRAVLARVLSENRVARAPARPAAAEYFQAWSDAVLLWLDRFFGRHPGLWEGVTQGLRVAAWLLVGVAVVLLFFALRNVLSRRARRTEASGAPAGVSPASPSARLDRESWRRELEVRLARGDIDGALEALWWWFASSLVGEVDPAWTSQQLLRAARRPDLAFAAAELDRALYGPLRPGVDGVSGLRTRLEAGVA